MRTDPWAVEAALNNAEWCDAVCRTHGIRGVFGADAWTVPRRSPPMYPDAVTLRPAADAYLLERIEVGEGASVKDSFADLDAAGFRILLDAEWMVRQPAADRGGPDLVAVTDPAALAAWSAAHGGGAVFRPALLADPTVTVWALPDPSGAAGTVVGGAVTNRSARCVGVSNVFARDGAVEDVWRGVFAALPDEPLVGYEHGEDLALAHRLGFRSVGPLRVWVRG